MPFDPEKPYNDLPILPPRIDLETSEVLKACIDAHRELAQLKMAEGLIPNQAVLIHSIPLLESQASSAVENIVTTTDDLFQFADSSWSSEMKPEVKETLRYRSALYRGIELIRRSPIGIATICEICGVIREIDVGIRQLPGTALVNDLTRHNIYTPPEGRELLHLLLSNWESYLHSEDGVDPLIKLAVQHYQFEAIHPFTDGNGRTGRIVNLLYLVDKGLLDTPVLYLSQYMIKNRADYYLKLLAVTTEGAWVDWVLFILDAVRSTAQWTTRKILAIQKLIADTCALVQDRVPSFYNRDLIELLFEQPYVRISNLVERGLMERQTASKRLKALCELDVLVEWRSGRDKLFINRKFLDLLQNST